MQNAIWKKRKFEEGKAMGKNSRNNLRKRVLAKTGGKCACCGINLQTTDCNSYDYCTIDHIQSRRLGGKSTFENYQPLCKRCNKLKGHYDFDEWINSIIEIGEYLCYRRAIGKL